MSMPEATVDEDDGVIFLQNKIRLAGQIFYVQAIAKAIGKQQSADGNFGLCIAAADAGHIAASFRGGFVVHVPTKGR